MTSSPAGDPFGHCLGWPVPDRDAGHSHDRRRERGMDRVRARAIDRLNDAVSQVAGTLWTMQRGIDWRRRRGSVRGRRGGTRNSRSDRTSLQPHDRRVAHPIETLQPRAVGEMKARDRILRANARVDGDQVACTPFHHFRLKRTRHGIDVAPVTASPFATSAASARDTDPGAVVTLLQEPRCEIQESARASQTS